MYEHIPNESLELSKIPLPDAPWEEINDFALTFNGYNYWEGKEDIAEIANNQRHNDLTDLRTCLFFEQRRCRWIYYDFDEIPEDQINYMRRLVWKIRQEYGDDTKHVFPENLRQFIKDEEWTFAKTYAKTWPHEYIVRQQVDKRQFLALARHIDIYGYEDYFYRMKQIYFDYQGYTYWHMDNIINRCVEEDTYHRRKIDGRLPRESK